MFEDTYHLFTSGLKGSQNLRDGSVAKCTDHSSSEPISNLQHSHDDSQPSLTAFPENLMTSSDLLGHACGLQTYADKTLIHIKSTKRKSFPRIIFSIENLR